MLMERAKTRCLKLDLFQLGVPQLNYQGDAKKASWCGVLVSIMMIMLLLLYGSFKFETLVTRKQPSVSFNKSPNELDSSAKLKLIENHRFAFSAQTESNNEYKSAIDPRYTKFMMIRTTMDHEKGDFEFEAVLFHKCTEAELREFV